MTEQEYIDLGDLEKLGFARKALGDICAPNSNVIDDDKLTEITSQINVWWWELQKNHININPSVDE